MARERIRKLAKRLNITVESLVEILHAIGHGRYHLPDDMLPDEVVLAVEQAIQRGRRPAPLKAPATKPLPPLVPASPTSSRLPPLPEAFPSDNPLHTVLKEYLAAKGGTEPARPAPPPKPVSPPTEALLRESLGAEIRQRRMLTEALETVQAELHHLKANLSQQTERELQLEDQLVRARDEATAQEALYQKQLAELRFQLNEASELELRMRTSSEGLRDRLNEERVNRQVAESRSTQLERRIKELENKLVAMPAAPAPRAELPPPAELPPEATPLDELLEQRGLRGPAETRATFEILLRDATFHETMECLATGVPRVFRNLLRRRISLVCESCEPPAGTAPLRVEPASRCEVCKGNAMILALQAFLSACRQRDMLTVRLLGAAPRVLTELQGLVDGALRLEGVEIPSLPDGAWARRQLEGADLVIVWSGGVLEGRIPILFRDMGEPRVVISALRTPALMLKHVTETLGQRWPRADRGALFGAVPSGPSRPER